MSQIEGGWLVHERISAFEAPAYLPFVMMAPTMESGARCRQQRPAANIGTSLQGYRPLFPSDESTCPPNTADGVASAMDQILRLASSAPPLSSAWRVPGRGLARPRLGTPQLEPGWPGSSVSDFGSQGMFSATEYWGEGEGRFEQSPGASF